MLRVSNQYVEVLTAYPIYVSASTSVTESGACAGTIDAVTIEEQLDTTATTSEDIVLSCVLNLVANTTATTSEDIVLSCLLNLVADTTATASEEAVALFSIRNLSVTTTVTPVIEPAYVRTYRHIRSLGTLVNESSTVAIVGPIEVFVVDTTAVVDLAYVGVTLEADSVTLVGSTETLGVAGTIYADCGTFVTVLEAADGLPYIARDVTTDVVETGSATFEKNYRVSTSVAVGSVASQGQSNLFVNTVVTALSVARKNPYSRTVTTTATASDVLRANIQSLLVATSATVSDTLESTKPINVSAVTSLINPITQYVVVEGITVPQIVYTGIDITVAVQKVLNLSVVTTVFDVEHQFGFLQRPDGSSYYFGTPPRTWENTWSILVTTRVVSHNSVAQQIFKSNRRAGTAVTETGTLLVKHVHNLSVEIEATVGGSAGPLKLRLTGRDEELNPYLPTPGVLSDVVFTGVGSITLRAPNLGNKDRFQFNRISRESRGGTLTVFADPAWSKLQTHVMTFSSLTQTQARGLLTFVEANLGTTVAFDDWEGRSWTGLIMNPDSPIIEDARGSYTATIEFEGQL